LQDADKVNHTRYALRLNVGFIVNQSVGFSREFVFDFPEINLEPDLVLNNLSGTARFTRTQQGLLAQVKMRADLPAACVRCLTDFDQSLEINFTELYAFSTRSTSESGLILPDDGYIDLAPLVREYMLLEVPINPLCTPDCRGLCPICGESFTENHHAHDEESLDPRLARLKELLEEEEKEE
jgi:uncharacterized protein